MRTDNELAGDQMSPFRRALSSSHMRMRHRCTAIAIVGMATVINGGTLAVAQAVPRSAQSSQSRNQSVPLLNKASRKDVVESLADELISGYVHADVGIQLAETIRNKLKSKAYDHIDSVDQFAMILTQECSMRYGNAKCEEKRGHGFERGVSKLMLIDSLGASQHD